MKHYPLFLLLALFSLQFISCGQDDQGNVDDDGYNRTQFLIDYAAGIKENHTQFSANAVALNERISVDFQSLSQAEIDSMRVSFKKTYLSWQSLDFLSFGPSADLQAIPFINTYPTDTAKIESFSNNPNYSLEIADAINAQGLPAIDYLLHDTSKLLNDTAAFLYLRALSTRLEQLSVALLEGWEAHEAEFTSNTSSAQGSPISSLFNSFNENFERRTRDGKIGIPVGVRTDNVPQPEQTEALYSDSFSVELAIANSKALKSFFNGYGKGGFADYLDYLGTTRNGILLSEQINDQFEAIESSLSSIERPLSESVVIDRTPVLDCFNEMQKMVVLLKVDMSAALGILINYNDNDGDS